MRHGTSSNRRQRSRGNGNSGRRSGGNQKMKVYDSNGPDVRIRGTAHQVVEKYQALAKDATVAGELILAESYLQHAEHYQRVINEFTKDVQSEATTAGNSHAENLDQDDDLSLPSSILGETSKVSPEAGNARTAELSTAS